jgi:hypothetical protein
MGGGRWEIEGGGDMHTNALDCLTFWTFWTFCVSLQLHFVTLHFDQLHYVTFMLYDATFSMQYLVLDVSSREMHARHTFTRTLPTPPQHI